MYKYLEKSIACISTQHTIVFVDLFIFLKSNDKLLMASFSFPTASSLLFLLIMANYTVILQKGFDPQWLSITFSKAIFLGNGLVAIVAGLFANFLADNMGFGPVSPFDAAACVLAIGMAIILSSWSENYGDSSDSKDLITQFKVAAKAIASGRFYLS